jgi:hypothetical protein
MRHAEANCSLPIRNYHSTVGHGDLAEWRSFTKRHGVLRVPSKKLKVAVRLLFACFCHRLHFCCSVSCVVCRSADAVRVSWRSECDCSDACTLFTPWKIVRRFIIWETASAPLIAPRAIWSPYRIWWRTDHEHTPHPYVRGSTLCTAVLKLRCGCSSHATVICSQLAVTQKKCFRRVWTWMQFFPYNNLSLSYCPIRLLLGKDGIDAS